MNIKKKKKTQSGDNHINPFLFVKLGDFSDEISVSSVREVPDYILLLNWKLFFIVQVYKDVLPKEHCEGWFIRPYDVTGN